MQPRFEFKKLKEKDIRVKGRQGISEVYYNKSSFEWWERNVELVSVLTSLVCDLLFLVVRCMKIFLGGFEDYVSVLLLTKNLIFSIHGIFFLAACGNSRHMFGPLRCAPLDTVARCIESTKIG